MILASPSSISVFLSTGELVDALILEHEAQSLGMPATADLAVQWLRQRTGGMASPRLFEDIYRKSNLSEQVTDEQLLLEIANQVRIRDVLELSPFTAEATPLDVYTAYRDQSEKVSAFAVPVRVEEFVKDVKDPGDEDVQALYNAAKNRYPDPDSPEPGFKIPKKVRFEVVTADVAALADAIQAKLTQQELRDTYEARKVEFPVATPPELPTSLFAGALRPHLRHDAFPDVKAEVARTLARERANDEINGKFDGRQEQRDAGLRGQVLATWTPPRASPRRSPRIASSPATSSRTRRLKAGLTFESTPLVPASATEQFGPIGPSRLGTGPSFDSPKFLDLGVFSPKT